MTDKLQKIADMTEKSLRKDLNAASPLPYQILSPESGGLPPQSLLTGMVQGRTQIQGNSGIGSIAGAKDIKPLGFVYFSLKQPRSFELQACAYAGLSTSLSRLAYAVLLRKPVDRPLEVIEAKQTGLMSRRKMGFAGKSGATARLNGDPDLLKLADKLVVTAISNRSIISYIDLFCQILPRPEGSLLVLHTLPRVLVGVLMGRETLQAAEVLQFAAAIESKL